VRAGLGETIASRDHEAGQRVLKARHAVEPRASALRLADGRAPSAING